MLNIKQGLVFLVSHCLLSQVVVYEEVRNVMLIFILWWVHVAGGVQNFPVTKPESLDIIEVLVCRAAKLEEHLEGSLVASSSQVAFSHFVSLQVLSRIVC